LLNDGKKRKRNWREFLFGFGAQTDTARNDSNEQKKRK
jgi:hypothetical protein